MLLAIKILFVAQRLYTGVGRLTVEVLRSQTQTYTDTSGRNSPEEGSACRTDLYLPSYKVHKRNIYTSGGILTHNPSKRGAVELRLRWRGHWDWKIGNDC
jgi:hypothetical protein